jgi:hypothetical protein
MGYGSKRVMVLYDTPPSLNEKTWITHELRDRGYDVIDVVLHSKTTVTRLSVRGLVGKVQCVLVSWEQAVRAVLASHKGDTILCWGPLAGHCVNEITYRLHLDRRIICMNWLTPTPADIANRFRRNCAANRNAVLLVNVESSARKYREQFASIGEPVRAQFHWFPDVFNDEIPFKTPNKTLNEHGRVQCFTGGMNNRDWSLIVSTARALPDIDFVCVALKEDWEHKVAGDVPSNLTCYTDLPLDTYYELMTNSTVVCLPLIEDRASGIINIIRCAQDGHLCCVTDRDFTRQYFEGGSSPYLLDNDVSSWVEAITSIAQMTPEQYCDAAARYQTYIRDTYSPSAGGKRLDAILQGEDPAL